MPIKINLLAEAQAAEDFRRRDPVKRAIWIGAGSVAMLLIYSLSLQFQAFIAGSEYKSLEARVTGKNADYLRVLAEQQKLADVETKLAALHQLATNRLLYGTLLNALQQATVDEVQLTQLRASQSYQLTEEVKAKTTNGKTTPGKPATATERILLALEARDSGPNAGDRIPKYKEAITESPYFKQVLGATNDIRLANFSPPQAAANGKSIVLFTLECKFPERIR